MFWEASAAILRGEGDWARTKTRSHVPALGETKEAHSSQGSFSSGSGQEQRLVSKADLFTPRSPPNSLAYLG